MRRDRRPVGGRTRRDSRSSSSSDASEVIEARRAAAGQRQDRVELPTTHIEHDTHRHAHTPPSTTHLSERNEDGVMEVADKKREVRDLPYKNVLDE